MNVEEIPLSSGTLKLHVQKKLNSLCHLLVLNSQFCTSDRTYKLNTYHRDFSTTKATGPFHIKHLDVLRVSVTNLRAVVWSLTCNKV